MEKQNRKFDIEWMRSKLEKYLTLWEQYYKNPKLRKQYSKPFIVSNLLETIGALERIGDKGREFSNLKNKYRVVVTSSLEEIVKEAVKALRQTDYPSLLNIFIENIKSTLKRGGDYYMLKDEGEDILIKRDELELVLQELGKIECGSLEKKEIAKIQTTLNQADKKLKESIRYFSFLKEFAEDYRARFNIRERNKFWWWFEIPERAVKVFSLKEWETLLKLSHMMPEATEYYEKTEECEQFEDVIPGYIDGMLPKQLEHRFEKHLKSCKYCLYQVMDLYRITHEMEKAKPEKVPKDMLEKAKKIVAPRLTEAEEEIKEIIKELIRISTPRPRSELPLYPDRVAERVEAAYPATPLLPIGAFLISLITISGLRRKALTYRGKKFKYEKKKLIEEIFSEIDSPKMLYELLLKLLEGRLEDKQMKRIFSKLPSEVRQEFDRKILSELLQQVPREDLDLLKALLYLKLGKWGKAKDSFINLLGSEQKTLALRGCIWSAIKANRARFAMKQAKVLCQSERISIKPQQILQEAKKQLPDDFLRLDVDQEISLEIKILNKVLMGLDQRKD